MRATKIMLIRHGEKPAMDGSVRGVSLQGEQSPDELTVRGWQRAGALVTFFAPRQADIRRPGIDVPQHLFAPGQTTQVRSVRAEHTIGPLSESLRLPISKDFRKGDEEALAAAVVQRPGVVLVAWEHRAIVSIANALMVSAERTPQTWPDERFDIVWVFERGDGGWTFTQVPQLLLHGDSVGLISG